MTNSSALADYPLVISLPVQWGEMDAFGHVNNIVFFRWFESARIAYALQAGLEKRGDIGPILASIRCDYRRQVFFPDTVHIGARVAKIGRASLTMEHAVYSETSEAIVAECESVIVLFDYAAGRPHRIDDSRREAIGRMEGRELP